MTGEQIEGMEDTRQMITLELDRLTFRFPEVHPDAACAIDFQRTLRIPDDGDDYPLPPGLGSFPLRHLTQRVAAVVLPKTLACLSDRDPKVSHVS